jgi:membrane protease YdiL (CAAX protease family)
VPAAFFSARRPVECAGFVAIWMACGWALPVNANEYLLLGVPLLAVFQLGVRRHPLRELWVRDARVFALRWPAPVLAVALAGLPAYELGSSLRTGQFGSTEAWLLCCLAGAGLAAFAIREQRLEALRRALPAFLAALALGCAVVAYAAVQSGGSPAVPFFRLRFLLTQFLFYFPVCFVLEEVVFRGALDAHVAQPGTTGARAWMSAVLVSVLWGVWHLPLAGANESFGSAALTTVAVHTLIGVPLSFCWRKGGTLVLPAAAHALIDAYRNTVL